MNENYGNGENRRPSSLQDEASGIADFKGTIPDIAEKEKRGKKVKIPKQEPYVQELTSNVELNIPAAN